MVLDHTKTVYTSLDDKGNEINHTVYNIKIKYFAKNRNYSTWLSSSYLDNTIEVFYNVKSPTAVVHIENFKNGFMVKCHSQDL